MTGLFLRSILLAGLALLIDWYFYQAVLTVTKSLSATKRAVIHWIYWGFTAYTVIIAVTPLFYPVQYWHKFLKVYLISFALLLVISKLIGVVFVLTDDLVRLGRWVYGVIIRLIQPQHLAQTAEKSGITRHEFLNQIALVAAILPFGSLLYGMFRGAFDYRVHQSTVTLPHLPQAFDGLTIVQISDLHVGSFQSPKPLQEAIQMIQEQKPDIIFFTGDLVNNEASELDGFISVLQKIKAPLGVFSTIGNHDYGDYLQWPSPAAKRENFERLKTLHGELGWTLLMNEHRVIERNGEQIAVLGVENWGANMNFPKRGDIAAAYRGTERYPVKLLLSHDPTHWDAQIRKDYTDINITFSGHTHGAQFGVEIPGWRWSPVQYFYKQWAGLYRAGEQYLYVNRGLGFLGYPGRVGILPEITVLQLQCG